MPPSPSRDLGTPIDRNIALELVRVTEGAAMAAAPYMGRNRKNDADGAAVDSMRRSLNFVDMDGVVVIGEGEKDEAPMLYIGERVGNGNTPLVDVAVDPIDGTRLVARGLPGGIATVSLAERGSMFYTHVPYMEKLIVGPKAAKVIDITDTVKNNLRRIAKAEDRHIADLTVVVLDRDRHETLLEETYYHRLRGGSGFAIQRVYTDDGTLDEAVAVSDGDVVLVPRGYHPVAGDPRVDLYYLNVMAGPVREWRVAVAPGY